MAVLKQAVAAIAHSIRQVISNFERTDQRKREEVPLVEEPLEGEHTLHLGDVVEALHYLEVLLAYVEKRNSEAFHISNHWVQLEP